MKKINKKGFTLVELLAVVVILGVLLMIAVPSVSNIIKTSKKKSFKSAASLAIENVETLASTERLESSIDECYVPLDDISLERGSFGSNSKGYIIVTEDAGKITGKIYISNDDFKITSGAIDSITVSDADDSPYDNIPSENKDATTDNDIPKCTWYKD